MEAGSLPTTKSALGAGRIIDARRRIKNLPLWLFALLTVAGFNAIAFGGLVCTRRFGQSLGLYTFIDNDTLGWIFSAILVMYALSLGLIAVASWGNASAAAAAASDEASHIATVYRTLGGYPQPLQDDLKDSIVRYTQSIIEKAWPAQQRGEVTEAGIEIILHLWSRITQFEPKTDGQHVIHGQVLDGFNKLVEFRRRRIEAASYAVPGTLWVVVLVGAAVSIFASYLFKIPSLPVHGLLTILLATMIALLVFFIATTDHPYSGSNAIKPLAYEIVLRYLQDYN
jgi:Protein of unknown function (DUF4239)